jgi:hypothetical protein
VVVRSPLRQMRMITSAILFSSLPRYLVLRGSAPAGQHSTRLMRLIPCWYLRVISVAPAGTDTIKATPFGTS